jgi:hypothetical protein
MKGGHADFRGRGRIAFGGKDEVCQISGGDEFGGRQRERPWHDRVDQVGVNADALRLDSGDFRPADAFRLIATGGELARRPWRRRTISGSRGDRS